MQVRHAGAAELPSFDADAALHAVLERREVRVISVARPR